MKNYISINVVEQTLLFCQTITVNKAFARVEIPRVRFSFGINPELALGFALQCDWMRDQAGTLVYTEIGNRIVKLFNGTRIDPSLWRTILGQYIKVCSPAWSRRIPYGRKEAYLIMNAEEQRCFDEAGLMDSQEEEVIRWWDSLAEIERIKKNDSLDDVGRKGERLTLKYEELRTKEKPDWRSIETNLCGYDILSQRSETDNTPLLIEVKSSIQKDDNAYAIISRREWDTAQLLINQERYMFYLWSLSDNGHRLAIIPAIEMLPYVPTDSGRGKWETVKIPFDAFETYFQAVTVKQ